MLRMAGILVWLVLIAPSVRAQSKPSDETLHARQEGVRERLQRLETRMLKLAESLNETEPQKAERLRDALQYSGKQQLKSRLETLTKLLRSSKLSDADQEQRRLVGDLEALLERLQSNENELDRRRAERERLEQQKRAIRTLMDDQTRLLNQTQELEASQSEKAAEIERRQRELEQKADQTRREMQRDSREMQQPGARNLEQSQEQMREAADELSQRDAKEAADAQKKALDQLQQSLNELDDALRQVRREETEQTLAALEARFRALLTREQDVRAAVAELAPRRESGWSRDDQGKLDHAVEEQRGVTADCETALRILRDEGTTVIVPELVAAIHTDMGMVGDRLSGGDVSAATRALLQDVVDSLEELLSAVEAKQADIENHAQQNQQQGQQGGNNDKQPLLPGSAELRLLRSSQVRINSRTEAAASDPAMLGELATRQRKLADLAKRMNERQ